MKFLYGNRSYRMENFYLINDYIKKLCNKKILITVWQSNSIEEKKVQGETYIQEINWKEYTMDLTIIPNKPLDVQLPLYFFIKSDELIFKTNIVKISKKSITVNIPEEFSNYRSEEDLMINKIINNEINNETETVPIKKIDFAEKRRSPRSSAPKSLKTKVINISNFKIKDIELLNLNDLSKGGMSFIIHRKSNYKVGDTVLVHKIGENKTNMKGCVKFIVSNKDDNNNYRVGIEFIPKF